MFWAIAALLALTISVLRDIVKKSLLNHSQPIQFVIIFYSCMFLIAQLTIPYVSIPTNETFILIIIVAMIAVVSNLLTLRVLKEMRITLFEPINGGMTSVLVVIFAMVFLGEFLTKLHFLGIALIIVPLSYLTLHDYRRGDVNKKHVMYLVMATVLDAFAIMLDRMIINQSDPFTYFYFVRIIQIVLFIGVMYIFYKDRIDMPFLRTHVAPIARLAAITMIGTYAYLFALSDPEALTGVIRSIIASAVVFTTFIGGHYFKEQDVMFHASMATVSIVGIILMIVA
ncbi:MAG TPA: hypothetical protein VJB66_02080 [Candidatus Nanoarchaeia archaeon]|nr:hypothetical protein [Candidatus Nanoarchaeia archaeon]